MLNRIRQLARRWMLPQITRQLEDLRRQAFAAPRNQSGVMELDGLRIRYVDLLSLYVEYKDIFRRRIYHFETGAPAPRIIDGGACIGMAALYFKRLYPDARLTCFEPDPDIASILTRNLVENGHPDVQIVPAALAATAGPLPFQPDGSDGGRLKKGSGYLFSSKKPEEIGKKKGTRTLYSGVRVPSVRLSTYLDEPVDFLKLNVEGAELEVLSEVGERLDRVGQLVLEYHGWPDGPHGLGPILELLDRHGFRYLLNHLDYETNGAVAPPFRLTADRPWFALVYARKAA